MTFRSERAFRNLLRFQSVADSAARYCLPHQWEYPESSRRVFGLCFGFLKRVIKNAMSKIQRELYEFGPFIIDAIERIVTRDGSPLPMTPKVFDTLLFFVRNHGRILTKDELLQKIWPGTFVAEVNLALGTLSLSMAGIWMAIRTSR